ncbi:hypothetical protein PTSG_12566 [Salpingoeca rosetta]|uniref:Uncharacterized protein n=1 Tax=Salpingoeca rosetta (strain ATCC 50818 / BSB-021) TaxID=946362 RepID=F2UIZ5_SALR5|nr:uncharacterized protein PTSG_12566 [Salpingoeca rosetta]EGD76943.1 hypothetical protein PTSG_12566 [Salpingoeca rosetta]|eukprot:XP_004990783.1 hypothetical protein PTSG_12566 [Salpingoeca rosetta]
MAIPVINVAPGLWFYVTAAIVDFITGALWYGKLFAHPWVRAMRRDKNSARWPEDSNMSMAAPMLFSLLTSCAQAYFVVHAMPHLLYGINGVHRIEASQDKAVLGVFWLFTGFQALHTIESALWCDRPLTVIAVDLGRNLVRILSTTGIAIAFGIYDQ